MAGEGFSRAFYPSQEHLSPRQLRAHQSIVKQVEAYHIAQAKARGTTKWGINCHSTSPQSLIIHEEKTKEVITEEEVCICDPNFMKFGALLL